jgi:hypothetical protein
MVAVHTSVQTNKYTRTTVCSPTKAALLAKRPFPPRERWFCQPGARRNNIGPGSSRSSLDFLEASAVTQSRCQALSAHTQWKGVRETSDARAGPSERKVQMLALLRVIGHRSAPIAARWRR